MAFKKGNIPWNKGKKGLHLSPKTEFKKGRIPWNKGLTKEHPLVLKYTLPKVGRKRPDISVKYRGKGNPYWKGGKTEIYHCLKGTREWNDWRKQVFKRDNYTCQTCQKRGGFLHPHHIIPVSINVKLVFEISNGKTLCRECHYEYHRHTRKQGEFKGSRETVTLSQAKKLEGAEVSPEIMDISALPERDDMTRTSQECEEVRNRKLTIT